MHDQFTRPTDPDQFIATTVLGVVEQMLGDFGAEVKVIDADMAEAFRNGDVAAMYEVSLAAQRLESALVQAMSIYWEDDDDPTTD